MTASFLTKKRNGLEWLVASNLAQFPWILHAFSTRLGGRSRPPAAGLNLGRAAEDQGAAVLKNRRMFFSALRAEKFPVAAVHQVHAAEILEVRWGPNGRLQYHLAGCRPDGEPCRAKPCGDAMLTAERGVLLSVRTADCLPILVADPQSRAVAAIHAGWRGALQRIAEKTIGEMRRVFGSGSRDLYAALGPCIGPCCYEVGEEVVDAFSGQFGSSGRYFRRIKEPTTVSAGLAGVSFLSMRSPGHGQPAGSGLALDLAAVARDQLRSAGVPASHIDAAGFCTSCRGDLFFSYRKEGGATGRMIAVIGMR